MLAALMGAAVPVSAQGTRFPGIGRAATPQEIKAWDIDVRPDFKGLPPGRGSVARGQEVWEAKCASCHGIFGESNEVFFPIVGGTAAADIRSGRVATLADESYPQRSTLMKLSSVATLWDYVNRAMPWTQPKSLSVEEVYAVTAYMLNLGGIVADDFVLSNENMAQVQQRLPNRHGMTLDHAMWPGAGLPGGARTGPRRPDVQGSACMRDCPTELKVASLLPDHARNAHGNLAEQNRLVGAQRGADTTRPAVAAAAAAAATEPAQAAPAAPRPAAGRDPVALARQHACLACHGLDNKVVGPGFAEIARKYAGRSDAVAYLSGRIRAGSTGAWGAVPMPPQSLPEADAHAISQWLAAGARR